MSMILHIHGTNQFSFTCDFPETYLISKHPPGNRKALDIFQSVTLLGVFRWLIE